MFSKDQNKTKVSRVDILRIVHQSDIIYHIFKKNDFELILLLFIMLKLIQ